ncbi:MAG: hypothetical protein K2L45_07805 [Muribaculaceae bacterium]|nr:hypothetical protein [Muribaculaceae bacterium]
MTFQTIRYKAFSLLALMGAVCAGCHSDAPCTPGGEEPDVPVPDPEKVTLCLNVSFDGQEGQTRAENDPDGYEDPSGDFEKISTLRVIIVRNYKEEPAANGGVFQTGIVEANRLVATNDQGHPIYDDLEFKVIANEKKRIYLVANEQYLTPPANFTTSINPTASKFLDTYSVDKVSTDLSSLTNWTVSLPDVPASGIVTRGLFSSSDSDKPGRLPLTEIFDDVFIDRKKAVDETCYSHLFLTRTAAKARFFLDTSDNFKNDGAIVPEIESISLSGIGTMEYVFPNNATYTPSKESLLGDTPTYTGNVENYINNFNMPPNSNIVTYLIEDINEKVIAIPSNEVQYLDEAKTKRLGKSISNTFYFPESILDNGENYNVTVKLKDGSILTAPIETNILKIAGKGNAIARNTYLPIVITFNGALDIRVEVLPWSSEVYEFDFSDHVGMSDDGAVSFIESTYAENGFDRNTGRLVLRDYPNATTGSFTIGSPVGHRWDAYLVTTQGEMNVIQFVTGKDASGNNVYSDHISGKVGEKVNFNVAATMSAGNQQREAILQVMVTLDYGGISVPVNILEGGSYGEGTENITFIQNAR